jgi:hypothetical protein
MEEVNIVNYTFAFAQFIKEHPEEAAHANSMVFVFEANERPVQTIIRSLN